MQRWMARIVLLLCVMTLAWRHWPERRSWTDSARDQRAVWKKLQQPIRFSHTHTSLKTAIDRWSQQSGVRADFDPVVFPPPALDFVSKPIDLPDLDLPADDILKIICRVADKNFVPAIANGQVWLTRRSTRDASDRFDVGQLHVIPPDMIVRPELTNHQIHACVDQLIRQVGPKDAGKGRVLPGALAISHQIEAQQLVSRLIDAIATVHRRPDRLEPLCVTHSHLGIPPSIERQLEQVVDVKAEEMPLADFVNMLRTRHGVPLLVAPEGVRLSQGIAPIPIRVDLKRVQLRSVLRTALRDHDLDIAYEHGVLWVTGKDLAKNASQVVVYPIGDLVKLGIVEEFIAELPWLLNWPMVNPEAALYRCGDAIIIHQHAMGHTQVADLLQQLRHTLTIPSIQPNGPNEKERRQLSLAERAMEERVTLRIENSTLRQALHQLAERMDVELVVSQNADTNPALRDQVVRVEANDEPWWSVFHRILAPFKLCCVARKDRVLEVRPTINEFDDDDDDYDVRVQIYNVSALVRENAAPTREPLLGIIGNEPRFNSMQQRCRRIVVLLQNALLVRQTTDSHRILSRFLDDLMQVPDFPGECGAIRPESRSIDSYMEWIENEPYVMRVYALPRQPALFDGQHRLRNAINAQILDPGQPSQLLTVDDRPAIIVAHSMSRQRLIDAFLLAVEATRQEDASIHAVDVSTQWKRHSLNRDGKASSLAVHSRRFTTELQRLNSLFEAQTLPDHDPLDSAPSAPHRRMHALYTHLTHAAQNELGTHRAFSWNERIGIFAEDEVPVDLPCQAIDQATVRLSSLLDQIESTPSKPAELRVNQTIQLLCDSTDPLDRTLTSLILLFQGDAKSAASDDSIKRLAAWTATVNDPLFVQDMLSLTEKCKDRSLPILSEVSRKYLAMTPETQYRIVTQLVALRAKGVPDLAWLAYTNKNEQSESALQYLMMIARTDKQAIQCILECFTGQDKNVQETLLGRLKPVDPHGVRIREAVRVLDDHADKEFKLDWQLFRPLIVKEFGDVP